MTMRAADNEETRHSEETLLAMVNDGQRSTSSASEDHVGLTPLLTKVCQKAFGSSLVACRLVARWDRPFSRIVQWELDLGDRQESVIAKYVIHSPHNRHYEREGHGAERESQGLLWAAQSLASSPDLRVPRVYLVDIDQELLVMEHVKGQVLDERLSAARIFSAAALRTQVEDELFRLGRWLRLFQGDVQWRDSQPEVLQWWDRTAQSRIDEIARHAHSRSIGLSYPTIDRLRTHLVDLRSRLEGPIPVASSHGDFGPWNALIQGQQLTVLDFFSFRQDLPWMDPLNVITYLEMLEASVTFRREWMGRFQRAFLRGYDRLDMQDSSPWLRYGLACQRLCRLQDALCRKSTRWWQRIQSRRTIDQLVRRLLQDECW